MLNSSARGKIAIEGIFGKAAPMQSPRTFRATRTTKPRLTGDFASTLRPPRSDSRQNGENQEEIAASKGL